MEKSFVVGRFWQSKVGVNINSHAELDSASAPLLIAKGQGEILKQVQDDGRSWFGLHAGFTLIELLVVVLIIGILAAIALPQYNVAVAKSRVSSVLPMLKSIAAAEEAYYLVNGTYTEDARELDIGVGCQTEVLSRQDLFWCDNYFLFDLEAKTTGSAVIANYCPHNNQRWADCDPTREFQVRFNLQHSAVQPGTKACRVLHNSAFGTKICTSLSSLFKS